MAKPLDIYGGKEAAQLLNVTPVTVSRWLSGGTMPDPDATLAAGPVWRGKALLDWGHPKGYLRCCLCSKRIAPDDKRALVIAGRARSVAHYWCNVDEQVDRAHDRDVYDLQAADADARGGDMRADADGPPDQDVPDA